VGPNDQLTERGGIQALNLESHGTGRAAAAEITRQLISSPSEEWGEKPAPKLSQAGELPRPRPRPLALRFPRASPEDPVPTVIFARDLQLGASNWLL